MSDTRNHSTDPGERTVLEIEGALEAGAASFRRDSHALANHGFWASAPKRTR